mgnify:CR=1 FL=1
MLTKKMALFFFVGFFAAAFLNINVTAVAIFAVLLALLLVDLKFRDGGGQFATQAAETMIRSRTTTKKEGGHFNGRADYC